MNKTDKTLQKTKLKKKGYVAALGMTFKYMCCVLIKMCKPYWMIVLSLSQYKIVVHASLPCPVCRSHRSRSLGFFPTYATNIPKYLVWLHSWSSMSI